MALADWIGRSPITCKGSSSDRYGRLIAKCFKGSEDLNGWMVAQGWAVAYRHYSHDYVLQEAQAEAAGRGIWSSTFVMPWDWRRGQRLTQAKAQAGRTGDCLIKGNINSRGDHIYHVPGGQYYGRTKIDESKGERWFCSETDARAAGWRRSKR